jgi:hypothetical protein
MANSAKTKQSVEKNAKSEDTVEETFQKMKANLIRYARGNDRRMILRSLKDVKLLQCLSLDVAQNSDGPLFDLEKEVAEQSMIINGVRVAGVSFHTNPLMKDTVTIAVKNSSIPLLKHLCRELCDKPHVTTSSRELYEKLIVRLAKSTASADPYFRLNSLLGSPDLLVMPLDNKYGSTPSLLPARGATGNTKPNEEPEPLATTFPSTQLNVYADNGEIHITLRQTHKFGLLRKADVKSNRPWLTIDAVVNERANLSTNNGIRHLKVVLPQLY